MFLTTGVGSKAVNSLIQVPYDTVDYDPNGNITTGASAKYTVAVSGYYHIDAHASINTSGVTSESTVFGSIFKNGAETSRVFRVTSVTLGLWTPSGSDTLLLAAGDTIDFRVEVGASSGTFSFENGVGGNTSLAIYYVGPS